MCEKSGCFPVPAEQVTKSTIDYNWAIWCVVFARICASQYHLSVPSLSACGLLHIYN